MAFASDEPLVVAVANDFTLKQGISLNSVPNVAQIITARLLDALVVHNKGKQGGAERVGAILAPIMFSIVNPKSSAVDDLFRNFLEWWGPNMDNYRHLLT